MVDVKIPNRRKYKVLQLHISQVLQVSFAGHAASQVTLPEGVGELVGGGEVMEKVRVVRLAHLPIVHHPAVPVVL